MTATKLEGRFALVRDVHALRRIETFVISGVLTLLITRALLSLTGYPRLGQGGLHIAHLLWGGLLMLGALVVLLTFTGPAVGDLLALPAGVGFGLFIDEIGKFVTTDNDYFYRPAVAIMYVVFVAVLLAARWAQDRRAFSANEYLANAVAVAVGGLVGGLPEHRRAESAALLDRAESLGADPAALAEGRRLLARCAPVQGSPGPVGLLRAALLRRIQPLLAAPVLPGVAGAVLLAQSAAGLIGAVLLIRAASGLPAVATAQLVSALTAGVLACFGLVRLGAARRAALRALRHSALVVLLFTEVFDFVEQEFTALLGVMVGLLALAVVSYQLRRLPEAPSAVAEGRRSGADQAVGEPYVQADHGTDQHRAQ